MGFLVPLVLASALAQEAPVDAAPTPEPPATPPVVEGCATVPPTPGVVDAGGVPALEASATWTEAGLEVRWQPTGAPRVRVHLTDGPSGQGAVEVFCEVVDDGAFRIEPARLGVLTDGSPWSFAVVRDVPSSRSWAMPWATVAGTAPVVSPSTPVASPVRSKLTAARVFLGVGGFGAAWGTSLGLFNASVGAQLPPLGTGITAGSSLPLEGFLVGADVSLRQAHREIGALGIRPPKERLVTAEALHYSGLGLQLAAALGVLFLEAGDVDVDGYYAGGVALGALQGVGSAMQLGATVLYGVEAHQLRGFAPAVKASADGAVVGVRAGF